MRIAVIGVGGVGGYFGGHLAAAGEDVLFVARGAHLAALRQDGLTVESERGPLNRLKVAATDNPAGHGSVDIVMLGVKLWDTEAALAQAKPLVGPQTAIVSFQNGIESVDRIAAAYGEQAALGGTCHIAAAIARPGVIAHTGSMARLTFGEPRGNDQAGGISTRVEAFAEACRRAKTFDAVASPDIRRAIWEKFVFLSSFSGMTALSRQPIGPIRATEEGRAAFLAALEEVSAIARAQGIALPPDHAAKALAFADSLPAEMKSSMLGDLMRNARLELPWLSGAVAALGRKLGIPTPVHTTITAALLPYASPAA